MVCLPLILFFVAAATLIFEEQKKAEDTTQVLDSIHFVNTASAWIHELQKERGASAGVLGKGDDASLITLLSKQYAITDSSASAYEQALQHVTDPNLRIAANKVLVDAQEINFLRTQVSSGSISVAEMAKWYSGIVESLMHEVSIIEKGVSDGGLGSLLASVDALMRAKENLGLERAMGANGFSSDNFSPEILLQFNHYGSMQEAFLETFRENANERFIVALEELNDASAHQEIQRLRNIANGRIVVEDFERISGKYWFEQISGFIEQVRAIEIQVLDDLENTAAEKAQTANSLMYFTLAGMAIGLIIAGIVCFLTVRSILSPLHRLRSELGNAALGKDIHFTDAEREGRNEFATVIKSATDIQRIINRSRAALAGLESASAAIGICDDKGKVTYANSTFARFINESEGFFKKQGADVSTIKGLMLSTLIPEINEVLNAATRDETLRQHALDFDNRHFQIDATPVHGLDDEIVGVAMQWNEVTSRRLLEHQVTDLVENAMRGEFGTQIESKISDPFLKNIVDSINKFCSQVGDFIDDLDGAVGALASGDLTGRVRGNFEGSFGELAQNVNSTMEGLAEMVSSMMETASSVSNSSKMLSQDAIKLSEETESQAAGVEQTSATMEQMSANVKSNSASAAHARVVSEEAQENALSKKELVEQAIGAMARLSKSSGRMSEIVEVIESISFQTNLLALNAAVEAARAGEAGKGFAVVAAEVRTLAQRAGDAAADIKKLISESSERVNEGVSLVERTGAALSEMSDAISSISEQINEIDGASSEQSNGIDEIASAMSNIDRATQSNAVLADRSSTASHALASEAEKLVSLVSGFKTPGGKQTHENKNHLAA